MTQSEILNYYIAITTVLFTLAIIAFCCYQLIYTRLDVDKTFNLVMIIVCSPILAMFFSIALIPGSVFGLFWLIAKGIHHLKTK